MKKLSLFLIILILSCAPQIPEPQIIYITDDDPEIITPDDPEIPEEEIPVIIAYLNYDGKLFSYDDKDTLKEMQDGDSLAKAGDKFIEAMGAGVYDGVTMYQGLDGNIYRLDVDDNAVLLFNNTRNEVAVFPSDGDGMILNFRFIQNNGLIDAQSYIAVDSGVAFKIIQPQSDWDKYVRKDKEWLKVGTSQFSDWIRHGQVNCDGKIIISTGSTLENDVLTEPYYDVLKRTYFGGNAFMRYIQPTAEKRLFVGIGYKDGIAYFFCARDGKIYRYDVVADTLSEWVTITPGTDNYEIRDSYPLFKATAATLIGSHIFYWSAGNIKKLSIIDGVTETIAASTELRIWAK